MNKVISSILAVVFFLAVGVIANADCIRCGSNIACVGDDIVDLQSKCGTPDYSDRRPKATGSRYSSEIIWIDEWTYNCGDGNLNRRVTLENGKIVRVESTGRGSGAQKCN